ncbi:MAG: 4-alpha-glucanotransferase [Myxococcales bacterium]|nr:4-alpha-glucanotransferase [Myxococcales bacterium]
MDLPRRSGVLLHITSLPGGAYTGDLGPSAYEFVDFLEEAGQGWWQTLPLNPIGESESPYSSISAFACEPLMISLESLVEDGLLDGRALRGLPSGSKAAKANFIESKPIRSKQRLEAYRRFEARGSREMRRSLAEFRDRERVWLDDYCMFITLRSRYGTADWTTWPQDIAQRQPSVLAAVRGELAGDIEYHAFEQFLFDRQWRSLRRHCKDRRVGIFGDVPMFVSHQSADVWAHREAFLLDERGYPSFVAGAPPDAFAADGQRWGNALYDWAHHERTGFAWWKSRLRRQLELFDLLRLDHFIGFARYWRIPSESETAMGGQWIDAPGHAFFDELRREHGELPLVAEDLGAVSQEVWDLRDSYGLPGMKVLQFAFGGDSGNRVHHPDEYPRKSVAFTGTHDSNTMLGWYRDLQHRAQSNDASARADLQRVQSYFGTSRDLDVVDAAVRTLLASPADTVIIPIQDLLRLDERHRMNRPGTTSGNWTWRLERGQLGQGLAIRLRALAEATGRL